MLGWDRYELHKKHNGTHYVKYLFLHPVGSTGDVVLSGTFEARNVDALFFMLGWDRYGFHKEHARTCYGELLFLEPMGSECDIMHSGTYGA
jgi:hypothetical protein